MDAKLTQALKKKGMEAGADIAGIAGARELLETAPQCDTRQFLAGARAVVIVLVADPPAVRAAADIEEYTALAFPGYQRADGAARSMMNFIEKRGYKTRFITREWHKMKTRHGKSADTISLKTAAVAAGLGSIGIHSLLISPEHGPRVRLSGFITDAPLVPDEPFTGELCNECGACAAACPSGAIANGQPFGFNACSAYLFARINLNELSAAARSLDIAALALNADRLVSSAANWLSALAAGKRLHYNCSACIRICNAQERKAPYRRKKDAGKR